MSKKTSLFLIRVFIFGLLFYLGYGIITKTKEKKFIAQHLQTIPQFELLTLEQKPFTDTNLKSNQNTIFIYFNSECDFCQHEAQSISNDLEAFKNEQLIFVSTESIAAIKQFSEQYKLNNQPNITFLNDINSHFTSRFGASSIPYILIYDNNQNLIKKHKGQLNTKGILRVLNTK